MASRIDQGQGGDEPGIKGNSKRSIVEVILDSAVNSIRIRSSLYTMKNRYGSSCASPGQAHVNGFIEFEIQIGIEIGTGIEVRYYFHFG
jgi:hypothetical protein